jgi:regulator of replication initiation timing
MDSSKSNILKVVVILLGISILGLGYYTYNMYNDFSATQKDLEIQKEELINELEGYKVDLSQAIEEKTEVSEQLTEAKTKIESLIEEIKKTKKINANVIRKYKKQIASLKAQRDELYRIADSLRVANQQLTVEKDSLKQDLTLQKQYADTLLNKNEELAKVVNKAKILYPTKLYASGVKVRNSGKVIETSRKWRAEQIRVCFTIPKNDILERGPQKFYIKVTNPEGVVLGSNNTINIDEDQITVSAMEEVIYENAALDVCIFVKPENKKKELIKGEYSIDIYHNGYKVGETSMKLK